MRLNQVKSTCLLPLMLALILVCCLHAIKAQQFSYPDLTIAQPLNSITSSAAFAAARARASNGLDGNLSFETVKNIALGAQQFGFDLLHRLSASAEAANRDIMISPFSIWSLLILMLEGSAGRTYDQLRQALHISVDDSVLRSVYKAWSSNLNVNTSTIEVASLQALFTDETLPIASSYRDILVNYNARQKSVNFKERNTYHQINEDTRKATRGLIKHTVAPQDIYNAKMFMLSSLFFKGQWTHPFNASLTTVEPFYDEQNNIIAQVPMMMQNNIFPYSTMISGLDGYVVELPYGEQDRLSMIIVLPKRGFTLHHVVGNLKEIGLAPILSKLAENKVKMPFADVEVVMPKFTTVTDITLNNILNEMGITNLFDSTAADLSRMANGLFVNLCVHSTKIIVDEEGTTASAVTSAVLINKTSPPKFNLNKPFQYMIVEKSTGLLLFAGQVRNPK